MVISVVEAVPTGSKPPAADDSMCPHGWKMRLWRFSAFVDQGVTDAFFRSQKRFVYFAEAGQTHRAVIDPGRRGISVLHSICCSALRTVVSLRVCFSVYVRGETWLLSLMLQSCYMLIFCSSFSVSLNLRSKWLVHPSKHLSNSFANIRRISYRESTRSRFILENMAITPRDNTLTPQTSTNVVLCWF